MKTGHWKFDNVEDVKNIAEDIKEPIAEWLSN